MDESRRLAMRRAHTKHKMFCTCGMIAAGNGGIASHRAMHARRADGHYGMTYSMWCDVQSGRAPKPEPRRPAPETEASVTRGATAPEGAPVAKKSRDEQNNPNPTLKDTDQ